MWPRDNNSRDDAAVVQAAIAAARPGVRVDAASNEAVIQGAVSLAAYDAVVWILGTESTAGRTFDATEQTLVEQFVAGGGHLFVTGAEVFDHRVRLHHVAADLPTPSGRAAVALQ